MSERFSRTEALVGSDNMKKLQESRVAVFGVGGVGGYVVRNGKCAVCARTFGVHTPFGNYLAVKVRQLLGQPRVL